MSIKLQNIMSQDLSYNEDAKKKFLAEARKVLKDLAKKLNLSPGTFNISTNKGGIAVSGGVILHTDTFYLSLEQSTFGSKEVLIRSCNGQKDYSGGVNNHLSVSDFESGKIKSMAKVLGKL